MIRRLREGFAAILDTMRHMATLVDPGEDDDLMVMADAIDGCTDPDCLLHTSDAWTAQDIRDAWAIGVQL